MAAATGAIAAVGAALSLAGGAVAAGKAKKAEGKAARQQRMAAANIARIKSRRRPIINPYANNQDLSGLVNNLSDMVTNPFANLGVATMAAEMQSQQADIALANALDNLAATGASAGGATALAQAALQSKKGIAASIEKQEAENARLRAQGEQNAQKLKITTQQMYDQMMMQEGQRLQTQEAAGNQFQMQLAEQRSMADLNHAAGKELQAMQNQASAAQAQAQAWGGAISGMASGAFQMGAAGMKG